MPKHQPYPRREFRRLAAEWRRRNRRGIVRVVLVASILLAALTAWCVIFAGESRVAWFVLGASQATMVAVAVQTLRSGFLFADPDAMGMLRGAWGEENTRSVLEGRQLARSLWGSVDSIDLQRGDIDHLVITRRGGLLVLDSKWRNRTHQAGIADMASHAQKAVLRSEAIAASVLKGREWSRHRSRGASVRVRPVVVLWGPAQRQIPNGVARRHGVDFVAGKRLKAWIRQLDGEPIDERAGRQLLTRLEEFRESCTARVTSAG